MVQILLPYELIRILSLIQSKKKNNYRYFSCRRLAISIPFFTLSVSPPTQEKFVLMSHITAKRNIRTQIDHSVIKTEM